MLEDIIETPRMTIPIPYCEPRSHKRCIPILDEIALKLQKSSTLA